MLFKARNLMFTLRL